MIQVNLLPPEYRAAAGTPVARFVAIVAGVVLVIGASCAFAYTHFIQLAKVREVKALREEEAASKEIQKERSLALQREIGEYEERRRAIQTINRNRVLWSRKLDQFFDIVYCSSVIEHVTLSKKDVWSEWSGRRFREAARVRQAEFAREIRRLGKRFFVQTPYRHFPIEPHSWLPFAAWLPRWALIPTLRLANVAWVTQPVPDWHLLDRGEMQALFGDARREGRDAAAVGAAALMTLGVVGALAATAFGVIVMTS